MAVKLMASGHGWKKEEKINLTKAHLQELVQRIVPGEEVYYENKDGEIRKNKVKSVLPFLILLRNGDTVSHFDWWRLNRRP